MIKLLELYPEHLNLNGDLANLRVLQKQFGMRGLDASIIQYRKGDPLPARPDFFVIGHGSVAAWADIQGDFETVLEHLAALSSEGVPGLFVASGFERSAQRVFDVAPGLTEYRSKFVVVDNELGKTLGYLNSASNLPLVHLTNNSIGTLLHGPILAKNPQLVERLVASICDRKGISAGDLVQSEEVDQMADLVKEIWKLEEQLASE